MSFLLDTDVCSAHLKDNPHVVARVMLHFGGLSVSTVVVGELLTWALRGNAPVGRERGVRDFLSACAVLPIDEPVAARFATLRADLLDRGLPVGEMDLFNAAVALVHDLTLVTHNTKDYQSIPGLALADWLLP